MTDKLRQAAQQALAALDELYYSNSTPLAEKLYEESSAALRTALAEQPAEQDRRQAYIDALPDHIEDKMFVQIDLWARQTYKRHQSQVRGQMSDSGDSHQTHIIYAAFRWAKEHGNPLVDATDAQQSAKPAEQEPVGEVVEVAQCYDERWTAIIETGSVELQKGDKVYTAPQPTIPPGYKLVPVGALTRWRDAFAEELSAWDINPPIHHVQASHDEIEAVLKENS